MVSRRRLAAVGLLLCLALLAALAVPYLVATTTAVGTYYESGVPGAYGVAAVTMLSFVAFWLELAGRVDAATAAGALLGFGLLLVVLAVLWATTVPSEVVMGLSTVDEMAYHRWLVVALAGLIALVGGWNAVGGTQPRTGAAVR